MPPYMMGMKNDSLIVSAKVLGPAAMKDGQIVDGLAPSVKAWFLVQCDIMSTRYAGPNSAPYTETILYDGQIYLNVRDGVCMGGFCVPSKLSAKVLRKAVAGYLSVLQNENAAPPAPPA